LKKSFYKTFLKLPIYYRNVASDVHLHGRFMSYGPQGLRCSGVQKRGYPTLPRSEKLFSERWLRGLAEAKLKKSFYKTFLKLPI